MRNAEFNHMTSRSPFSSILKPRHFYAMHVKLNMPGQPKAIKCPGMAQISAYYCLILILQAYSLWSLQIVEWKVYTGLWLRNVDTSVFTNMIPTHCCLLYPFIKAFWSDYGYTCKHHWTGLSPISKPWSWTILTCCWLNPREQTSLKSELFPSFRKFFLKMKSVFWWSYCAGLGVSDQLF